MSAPGVVVNDEKGRQAFAFDARTDPDSVLAMVAWGWPNGEKLCDVEGCPRVDGGYCIECHSVGSHALDEAKRRVRVEGVETIQ